MSKRSRRSDSDGEKVTGSTSREPDDGRRGVVAVVVSLLRLDDGAVRIVMDDAHAAPGHRWETTGLFTSRDYPATPLTEADLAKDELEQMGLTVLSRLAALEQTRKT